MLQRRTWKTAEEATLFPALIQEGDERERFRTLNKVRDEIPSTRFPWRDSLDLLETSRGGQVALQSSISLSDFHQVIQPRSDCQIQVVPTHRS